MTTALVLGGGGIVGVAWQLGLFDGLRTHGVDPGRADLVLGTSAGSMAGALLLLGRTEILDRLESATAVLGGGDVTALLDAMAAGGDIGRLAIDAATMPEDAYVALVADLVGAQWPDRFRCAGIDVVTGELLVWQRDSGVPVASAVAASCAVPLMLPVVTVGGRRCMDGGMRDPLNAGLATGHDHVVAVSCFPVTAAPPAMRAQQRAVERSLIDLRAAGVHVEVIEPDREFLAVSDNGGALMDQARLRAAHRAGLRLGARSTPTLA
ncbi:patatin-like phospholipase family protein [Kutzneria sp. CA-103260]|uniref:patatin-like phospholipase family protein n=1 Tax=Kutzneria sp. CA-103260 TaxID=2802641 RepID=UPI001BA6B302|nr:patatin-like phospholipase family protein [Kutzneria sp. CA-103260]QUQ72597.1 patatin-like phospholipase [Kutzneria sp. CA-103260]